MKRIQYHSSGAICLVVLIAFIAGAMTAASRQREPTSKRAEASAVIPHGSSGAPPPPLTAEESTGLAELRASSIKGDRSKTTPILAALDHKHVTHIITGLHAAALLSLEEAIPRIDGIISSHPVDYVRIHAIASRARLRAEAAVNGQANSAQKAATKVQTFLREAQLETHAINATVRAFERPRLEGGTWPVELYALRELSDMVYGDYSHSKYVPEVKLLDFSRDYGAALKFRLAPLSGTARLQTM